MDKELEEAAERHYINCIPSDRHSFISGANYLAERMYSEEDLRQAYTVGKHGGVNQTHYDFDEWFEQFKKK